MKTHLFKRDILKLGLKRGELPDIFGRTDVEKYLSCSHNTARQILATLETEGLILYCGDSSCKGARYKYFQVYDRVDDMIERTLQACSDFELANEITRRF